MEPACAPEGQKFRLKVYEGGKRVTREYKVQSSCGGKRGEWVCATHEKTFGNNFEKDSHISDEDHKKRCVLVWHCCECGNMEVP